MDQNSTDPAFMLEELQTAAQIDKQGRLNASTQGLIVNGQISPAQKNDRVRYIQPDSMLDDVRNRYL